MTTTDKITLAGVVVTLIVPVALYLVERTRQKRARRSAVAPELRPALETMRARLAQVIETGGYRSTGVLDDEAARAARSRLSDLMPRVGDEALQELCGGLGVKWDHAVRRAPQSRGELNVRIRAEARPDTFGRELHEHVEAAREGRELAGRALRRLSELEADA